METIICRSPQELANICAQEVKKQLRAKPDSLLCFPAGNTVIETCERLKEMQDAGEIDFSQAEFVALDEWVGLKDEQENCTNFLRKHLYVPLGILPEQLTLFDTRQQDLEKECKRVDEAIFDRGGIDLMLLGLGMNGHLGLNEPGCDFSAYSIVVDLAPTTMQVGRKYFSGPITLSKGITLGVAHIIEAKKVLLQVSGDAKKDIVYALYANEATTDLPGTVLKLHKNSMIVLDEEAAQRIRSDLAK